MKILIIGAGSIGRRHIGNLNSLGFMDVDIADVDVVSLENVKNNYRIGHTFTDYRKAIASVKYDAALVLTPPVLHVPIALELANKGIDLFIEKPLSNGLDGIDDLIKIKERSRIVAMVGYNQRFNFCLGLIKQAVDRGDLGKIYYIRAEFGQYLPDWRPTQDYRKNYTARKDLGGGIIADASHELDYVIWLAGGDVVKVLSMNDKLSLLDIDVEDFSEVVMQFDNRVVGSVHMNMIERGYNRYCKIIGEKGTIKWTLKDNSIEHYDGASEKTTIEKYSLDPNHSYMEEMKHFLSCVESRHEPASNLYTAKKVVELIKMIKEQS